MLEYLLVLPSIVCAAALFGGMLCFAGLVLPMVHAQLPRDTAVDFVEDLFPRYYVLSAVIALIGVGFSFKPNPIGAAVFGLIALSFIYARVFLLPRVNAARKAAETGRFGRLHKQSVYLGVVQILVVMGNLLFLAIAGPLAALLYH